MSLWSPRTSIFAFKNAQAMHNMVIQRKYCNILPKMICNIAKPKPMFSDFSAYLFYIYHRMVSLLSSLYTTFSLHRYLRDYVFLKT